MSRLRAARGIAVLVWLTATVAFAAEPWYEAYESALKAISGRQWAVAEAKLKLAIKDGPKPGRRVRTYGMQYVDYIPDYHLGVVYFNQQRPREALEQFRKVAQSGLLASDDPEQRTLADLTGKAEATLAPKPEPSKAAEAPKVVAEAPKPAPSEPPREVPPPPREASAVPPPTLPSRAPERPPPSLAAPRPPTTTPALPGGPAAREAPQGAALRAFFAGRYEEAARKLEELSAARDKNAATLFYLGASHAALGLLRDAERGERFERARRAFVEARRLSPGFEADPGLVSPRILKLWQDSRR